MAKRKYQEPQAYTVYIVGGEQIVGTALHDSDRRAAYAVELEAELGLDGTPMNRVIAELGWTRAELERMAKAGCAPSYILEEDFDWND